MKRSGESHGLTVQHCSTKPYRDNHKDDYYKTCEQYIF